MKSILMIVLAVLVLVGCETKEESKPVIEKTDTVVTVDIDIVEGENSTEGELDGSVVEETVETIDTVVILKDSTVIVTVDEVTVVKDSVVTLVTD